MLPGRTHRGPIVLLLLCAWVFSAGATRLPAVVIHVSPGGDDHHPGTSDLPLQTISAAAVRAAPGDTVLVHEGVYRERVAPPRGGEPDRPITYRAAPGERVLVKGSEVWAPEWNDEGGGVFSAKPDERLFDDSGAEFTDHHNPLKVNLASTPWSRAGRKEKERGFGGDDSLVYTCGQVFVDGRPLLEVPFRAELRDGAWFYDPQSEAVFVHLGGRRPADHLVELTTRRRIFAPKVRGLGHIVVEGFVFEHCGNQYPTNFWKDDANAQRGAVGTEAGHHWVIRRNVVRFAKTFAIDVGRVDQHSPRDAAHDNLVEENYVVDNGSAGILSSGSVNLRIRGNMILRNNRLRFLGLKRWEQAGIKCHQFKDGHINDNYIADNFDTYGIWLDNQFPDSRVSRNVIHHNGRAGIFLEMSDYGFDRLLVDNNIVIGNEENAVYVHDASGATFVNNLLANTRGASGYGQAVYIRQVSARTKTYHHTFYNNLLLGNARNLDVNYPAARGGAQRFDHNVYGVEVDERAFFINSASDKPSPWTPDEFQERVLADLKTGSAPHGMMKARGKAALDLREWRDFWRRHGVDNDGGSRCDAGGRVRYERDQCLLTIELDADPTELGCREHPALRQDFFGEVRSAPGDSAVGPFRGLHAGKNQFMIWDGLPALGEFELPPVEWNAGLEVSHQEQRQADP